MRGLRRDESIFFEMGIITWDSVLNYAIDKREGGTKSSMSQFHKS
jgi:hypothetical protein